MGLVPDEGCGRGARARHAPIQRSMIAFMRAASGRLQSTVRIPGTGEHRVECGGEI